MSTIYVSDILNTPKTVKGTSFDDEISSDRYQATIYGYGGNDSIWIGSVENVVDSGDGDDTVEVWSNFSTIYGGAGNDSIVIHENYAEVDGGAGDDYIEVNSTTKDRNNLTVSGGGGNNTFAFTNYHFTNPTTFGFIINDLHNGDTIKSTVELSIGLEISTVKGNVVLTEVGNSEVNITLKGISDISQVADVTFRTLGEQKTLGEIFIEDSSTIKNEPETIEPAPVTTRSVDTDTNTTPASNTNDTASSGGTTIIYNIDSGGGDVVIGNNNIVKSGNTWTYNGGNKVIENYQQGEVVELASNYQGIDLNGNSFYVKSSSGSLEIQNSRDKFIGYSAGGQTAAYSYVASGSGTVDGRNYSQAEIMIGGENADNQIIAGSGGSSLWGGVGGNDTLTGGSSYNEFFYAVGGGSDIIQNANDNDLINLASINLSQIAGVDVNIGQVNINFIDGGRLQVNGGSGVGYQIAEGTFQVNQSTKQWSAK